VVETSLAGGRGAVPRPLAAAIRAAYEGGAAGQDLVTAERGGARFAVPGGEDYPEILHGIARPPIGFYVAGLPLERLQPALAVVGTRTATRRGLAIARDLAFDAASAGLTVVSGMARGIDTAAHEGALEAGGATVAVLGSGLSRIYPSENERLAREIVRRGAIVSEYPMLQGPRAGSFPARNRIIAGLSAGVVVVEAGHRSGALITAARALEEGREVFAVPGPVTEPLSRGPNGLIKAGAALVEGIEDILNELRPAWGPLWEPQQDAPAGGADVGDGRPAAESRGVGGAATGPSSRIRALLTEQPLSVDELCELTGLAAGVVTSTLFELELAGQAAACPGARYARAKARVLK
jgi:DNA processing protein